MQVYKSDNLVKVKDAPKGLLKLEDCDEIIFITDYYRPNGRREAYLVSNGDAYHGDGDDALGYPLIIN